MKKLLAGLAFVSLVTMGYAQGTVILQNSSAAYLISTNDGNGHIGVTTKTSDTFHFAVLISPYNQGAPQDNPLDTHWSAPVLTGANFTVTAGGIAGQGGFAGAPATGWGAPTANNYTDGMEMYFIIVGWSTQMGNTWADAKNNAANPPIGSIWGWSDIGYGYTGGGPVFLPATSLWGVSAGMPGGLTSGFVIGVPEPTTIALAGLGGLSLLLLRRRK